MHAGGQGFDSLILHSKRDKNKDKRYTKKKYKGKLGSIPGISSTLRKGKFFDVLEKLVKFTTNEKEITKRVIRST